MAVCETEPVNPIAELHRQIAEYDKRITALLARAESAGMYGDRRFQNLNATRYRSQAEDIAFQREAAIKQLESHGVKFARKIQFPETPMPLRVFKLRVIAGGPTGLLVMTGPIGCPHEIPAKNYEEAEERAIEEHRERCEA